MMEEERHQKELFEFEKPKKRFRGFADIFPKAGFGANFAVMLTLEKAIFMSLAAIMLLVVVFALGVERGKSMPKDVSPAALPKKTAQILTAPVKAASPVQAAPARPAAEAASRPYTIVAAAFSRREYAAREAGRLKRSGFDAFVAESDPYFLACVGAYADRSGARTQEDLNKVRKLYKDAYTKLMRV